MKRILCIVIAAALLASCSVELGFLDVADKSEPSVTLHESSSEPEASSSSEPEASSSSEPEASSSSEPETSSSASSSSKAPSSSSSSKAPSKAPPPAQSSEPPSSDNEGYLPDIEREVLRLINEEREANGLHALEYNADLRRGARIRSKEMYANDYFAHTRPDGREWSTVIDDDLGIITEWRGENLAMVYIENAGIVHQTAQYWVQAWIDSPGHYANILKEEYTHAAIGIYYHYDGHTFYTYATNLFASF